MNTNCVNSTQGLTDELADTLDFITHESVERERYELQSGPAYHFAPSRREFVAVVGAGLVITVCGNRAMAQRPGRVRGQGQSRRTNISQRLHIGEDGKVTVMTGKVEVGQDARTQMGQATAEELGISLDQVQVLMGDTELCPNDGGTFGSGTTPRTIPQVRMAAAAVREVLLDLAASSLGAKRDDLTMLPAGVVSDGHGKKISIAQLVKGSSAADKLDAPVDPNVTVHRVEQWTVLGTSPHKLGAESVVTGTKQYPSDIRQPGMLYGKVLRGPAPAQL